MTASPKRADSITAPLRHSVFRRIWLASLLSNLGLLIQGVGAAWAMTQMTSTANKVALVQTALMLPIMLISMPAGAIADMHDRRIVALVSLLISLTGASALTVLAWFNLITPNALLLFCFALTLPWMAVGFWNAALGFLLVRFSENPLRTTFPRAADVRRLRSFSARKPAGASSTHWCSSLQSLCELLARGPLGISLVVASGHLLYVTIPKSVSNHTVHQTRCHQALRRLLK